MERARLLETNPPHMTKAITGTKGIADWIGDLQAAERAESRTKGLRNRYYQPFLGNVATQEVQAFLQGTRDDNTVSSGLGYPVETEGEERGVASFQWEFCPFSSSMFPSPSSSLSLSFPAASVPHGFVEDCYAGTGAVVMVGEI